MALRSLLAFFSSAICLPLFIFLPSLCWATEWSLTPSLDLGYVYNDNIGLTLAPHDSVHGRTVAARVDMKARAEVWDVGVGARLHNTRYSEETTLDRDNRLYTFVSNYKTERNLWGLNASLTQDTTLDVETIDPDAIDPDAGLVEEDSERETISVKPSWTWIATERTRLQFNYNFSDVSYENDINSTLNDYEAWRASLSLLYQLSLRDQVSLSVSGASFEVTEFVNAPGITRESKDKNIQLGVTHAFSETFNGSLSAGVRDTTTDTIITSNITVSGTDTGTVYSASLQKQFELSRISLSASRGLTPSSAGTVVETDTVSLGLNRPLSERLKASVSASSVNYDALSRTLTQVDRRQYQVSPRLRWQWSRELNMQLSYRYTWLKRKTDPESVNSNRVNLTLGYQWPSMTISR